ncbi:MAG TPA: hypothetical protein VNV42_00615 [Solirubrobacteraceae bacterium]|jgi:hypothetical protein|nr:hypothetical protein [Solirubrobacteraceae bacterium]
MSEGSDREPSGDPPGQPPAADRRGPTRELTLAAERHRKPDGRLLILYHWDGEDG